MIEERGDRNNFLFDWLYKKLGEPIEPVKYAKNYAPVVKEKKKFSDKNLLEGPKTPFTDKISKTSKFQN
jgi:hypothetical protein